jgi:hypothetical protein
MPSVEDHLQEKNVDELRAQARTEKVAGASGMRKDELVEALSQTNGAASPKKPGLTDWLRDRSLGVFFLSLFFATWLAQLFVEWKVYADEQAEHGASAIFWSANFWETFWQSTLENWQSEFLQVAAFAIAAAYLVFKGSSESPDSDERVEAKIDAIIDHLGLDVRQIESELPAKYRKTT